MSQSLSSLPDSALPASGRSRSQPLIVSAVVTSVVAAIVVAATVISGTMDASNVTLVTMGFDQDRAQLITSLLVGGIAAAAAVLVTNRSWQAILAGLVGFAALFGPTFVGETNNALSQSTGGGSFDLSGWLLTVLTLPTIGFIASWAGATLARALRPSLIRAGSDVVGMGRSRRPARRLILRPLGLALALVLLVVTVPVFGDMVNYTPDSRMIHGGAPLTGLAGGPADPTATPAPLDSTAPGDSPAIGVVPSATPSGSTSPAKKPWLAWRPSGQGAVSTAMLPAPWKGVPTKQVALDIYTPPGYSPTGTLRYPVVYEADYGFNSWDHGANMKAVLDSLIDSGTIPPTIFAFIGTGGAPYTDTECANSFDGKEWIDTYISQTVVSYLDSHYLTIARANARATFGFSQGGYCAATLVLLHPSVFGSAIAFSGYYRAGRGSPASGDPFNNNPSLEAAASPMVLVSQVPAAVRSGLFFVLVADPQQGSYGPRWAEFANTLESLGYPKVALAATVPHGWVQVRQQLQAALEAWAARLASTDALTS
jgi:enterochelin esterase-like enzyme